MANFDKAFTQLLRHEGGYNNHPHDKGGETFCGIARNSWPHWEGWKIVDAYKAAGETPKPDLILVAFVRTFYRENYWRRMGQIESQRLAYALFDTTAQFGYGRAVETVQRILGGLDVDGILGFNTLKALNAANPDETVEKIKAWRTERRAKVIANKPSQAVFANGWKARDEAL